MTSNAPNSFKHLYQERMKEATRVFGARGKSVERCESCMLAKQACLCEWIPQGECVSEFVLLMHRDEVFKPTNTGRLIADAFPQQTHAYCWDRTQPPAELLNMIRDPKRHCVILYPANQKELEGKPRQIHSSVPQNTTTTFILLDGTWKQSRRMIHLSRWLDKVDCLSLPENDIANLMSGYGVRKADRTERISTAQAASLCLSLAGEEQAAQLLHDYFQIFNAHYLATRGSYTPEVGELHRRLKQIL